MANYIKIYNKNNILDYYKYRVDKLEKENKELKNKLKDKEIYNRLKEVEKILNSTRNHYKNNEINNAIDRALKIIKGE